MGAKRLNRAHQPFRQWDPRPPAHCLRYRLSQLVDAQVHPRAHIQEGERLNCSIPRCIQTVRLPSRPREGLQLPPPRGSGESAPAARGCGWGDRCRLAHAELDAADLGDRRQLIRGLVLGKPAFYNRSIEQIELLARGGE
jgi:hypothetical protein